MYSWWKIGAYGGGSSQDIAVGYIPNNIIDPKNSAPTFVSLTTHKQATIFYIRSAQQSACWFISPNVFEVAPHHAEQAESVEDTLGILARGHEIF